MNKCPNCKHIFSNRFLIGKYLGNSNEYWFCENCNSCLKYDPKKRLHTIYFALIGVITISLVFEFYSNSLAYIGILIILVLLINVISRERIIELKGGYIVRNTIKNKQEFILYEDWIQMQKKDLYEIITDKK